MISPQTIRKDFPLLCQNDVAYLDSAATSQRPQCVLDAITNFYETKNANPLRGLYDLSVAATEAYEDARRTVASFLGAEGAEEIIFTRNTTESINLVAYSYGLSHLHAGDEVVVSVLEHHSNLLPWQMVCRQTGASLNFLECDATGKISKEQIEAVIGPKTKLVAVTHVSNVLGVTLPVQDIIQAAHAVGAVVLLDGAQAAPHIPVNVTELDADFYAFSGHKLLGPMGIGVLYGKRQLLEEMPPFLSGGEMIEYVTRNDATYAEVPHKFEAGTVNAAGAVGLQAAIRYLQQVGLEETHAWEAQLTQEAFRLLGSLPFVTILGDPDPAQHCGIVTFLVDGVHPHDVSQYLSSKGVAVRAGHHCAQPLLKHLGVRSTTRASFMFYNTMEEVQRLYEALKTVRGAMGYGE